MARRPMRGRTGGRPNRLRSEICVGDLDGSKTDAFGFILAFGSGEGQPESELRAGLEPRESKIKNKSKYLLKVSKKMGEKI